jgi:hypothetical protein
MGKKELQLKSDSNRYESIIECTWTGPYGWPKFEIESNLSPIPRQPGVYLQTVEYQSGYLIYAAGLTRRSMPKRFREHTYKYMSGDYNVLDIDAMQQGVRKEIWHGWGWSTEKREEFEKQKSIIHKAVHKQLMGFRIFVTNVGTKPRILERIEASTMNTLYQQPSPFCDIPDRGMMLAPRWNTESPILVKNKCAVMLYGLPPFLDI